MTEAQTKEYNNLMDSAAKYGVPEHLLPGLALYIVLGVQPGGFLTAVLENNLKESVATGDYESLAGLVVLVRFMHNNMPSAAWGSPDKVKEWMEEQYANRQA